MIRPKLYGLGRSLRKSIWILAVLDKGGYLPISGLWGFTLRFSPGEMKKNWGQIVQTRANFKTIKKHHTGESRCPEKN
ncbi:MAG: hypothetical protein C0403_02240 [Desulfobacterium sp.]|nr:hypothetical protein [Desulfobacterium sp.]